MTDTEYESEEGVTIDSFGLAVSKAFLTGYKLTPAIYGATPATDISGIEKVTIAMFNVIHTVKNVKDITMSNASNNLLKQLQKKNALKMFVVAEDEELFRKYYPEHTLYY